MSVADVDESAPTGFQVNLTNFEGPFDLLLQLISKHELDITEVALSAVTGEFIAYIKALGDDLEQRGLDGAELVEGVRPLPMPMLPAFLASYDRVWHW